MTELSSGLTPVRLATEELPPYAPHHAAKHKLIREYANVWVGMWWALQTVTTVGYGDVTPKNTIGRLIASVVMLEGIAFLAIITAAITSTFVARATRERAVAEGAEEANFEARSKRDSTNSPRASTASRRCSAIPTPTHG